MSILYRPQPVIDATKTVLIAVLPATIDGAQLLVDVDTAEWSVPQVVLEQAGGPDLTSAHWGGPDWAVLHLQVTSIGSTRTQARLLGDLVREALAGVDRHGQALHPIVPAGAKVDQVASQADGHLAQDNPSTWVETFAIRYVQA